MGLFGLTPPSGAYLASLKGEEWFLFIEDNKIILALQAKKNTEDHILVEFVLD